MDIEPEEVSKLAKEQGCQGIAYTYNEPTIFIEFARDIGIEAHRKGPVQHLRVKWICDARISRRDEQVSRLHNGGL